MHTYHVKFIIDEKTGNQFNFVSNEKPFKGEVYTLQEPDGKLWDAKVTDVKKIILRNNEEATIEYRCQVEENKAAQVIGFSKS